MRTHVHTISNHSIRSYDPTSYDSFSQRNISPSWVIISIMELLGRSLQIIDSIVSVVLTSLYTFYDIPTVSYYYEFPNLNTHELKFRELIKNLTIIILKTERVASNIIQKPHILDLLETVCFLYVQ